MRVFAATLILAAWAAQAAQVNVTIRLSPLDAGLTIPAQGGHSVNASQSYDLSVIANSGYVFKSWSSSSGATVASATAANTTFSATATAEIVANFEANIEPVYLNIADYPDSTVGSTVPAFGRHQYHLGDQIIINAIPDSGQQFSRWQAFGKAQIEDKWAAETTLVVGGQGKAVACFMPIAVTTNYTAFSSPFNVGTITPSGINAATVGAAIAISATADSGFKFVRWELDGYGSLSAASAGSSNATFNGTSRLIAHFAPDPTLVFKTATVKIATSPADCGATCSPPTGSYNYFVGDSLAISATSPTDSGYSFLRWELNGQALLDKRRSPSASAVIYNDCDLTAVYAPTSQVATLTLASGGNGAVSPAQSVSVQTDTDFPIRATAQGGYFFAYWSAADSDSDKVSFANPHAADTTVRLTAPTTLTANFMPQTIWIGRSLPRLNITLNTLKDNSDDILVDRALLLNQKADFAAAGSAYVVVDGTTFPFDFATAVPFANGYTLTTRAPAARLTLNFTNNSWSFRASKISLATDLSLTNGLDLYLSAGPPELGQIDGANFFVQIKSSWNFNSNSGVQTNLDVPGAQFADFGVLKAKQNISTSNLSSLSIQKATATLADGVSFDNSSDFLYCRVDDLLLYFYSGVLTKKGVDKYSFAQTASGLNFMVDFKKDAFTFNLSNQIVPWVASSGDGADVFLGVPNKANGGVHLKLQGKTKLVYPIPASTK